MDFTWKYLYLLVGILLLGTGLYALFMRPSKVAEKDSVSFEGRFFIVLVALVLSFILLRQSWVMFHGLSRSVVF